MSRASVQRTVDAGLRFTPLAETIADTLAWAQAVEEDTDAVDTYAGEADALVITSSLRSVRQQCHVQTKMKRMICSTCSRTKSEKDCLKLSS